MYLIGNELLFRAKVAEREREVRAMTPTLKLPQRTSIRAVVATRLAQLALRIDRDKAADTSGRQPVDFLSRRSS